jgi:uncharacterized repeat protein (TIGR03803 family)
MDGNFYGTTLAGGNQGQGTVFSMTHAGLMTMLVSLGGTNGAQPMAVLTAATNGDLFGTTSAGGSNGRGTVFTVTPSGVLTSLVSFDGTNGAQPLGGLVQANGKFYGAASAGGSNDLGTVFSVTSAGVLSALVTFAGTNGAHPSAGLALGNDGNFYGTTSAGGTFGLGTVFQVTPAGRLTLLHSFTGAGDGSAPQARLLKGADGNFYGTTAGGGTNDNGTVFKATAAGAFTTLASFNGTNGAKPFAGLIQSGDGNFYGTTRSGSTNGSGSVFSLNATGAVTTLYAFTGGSDGASVSTGLTQGTNGNFYGVTTGGGRGQGTIYQLSGFPPFIVTQPASQTVSSNTTVQFSVAASGSQPLSFQWQFNSNNLADGGRISGALTPALTLNNVTTSDAGNYSVIVSSPGGSVASAAAVLKVVNPYPLLTIDSPARNSIVNKLSVVVAGSAKGDLAVARVYFQLNQTGWQLASTTNGWTNWTATITPPPGTNTIQAYAVNVVGTPSATNSVNFVCAVTGAVVTVQIIGNGTVSPNYNGRDLVVGRSYSMTARAGSGYFFSNWSGDRSTNAAKLSFVVESNMVLQANFIANPFSSVKGTYNGLFRESGNVSTSSSGLFTFTVTDKGKFTGNLQMAAGRSAMSGQFDADGHAQLVIGRPKLKPLLLDMQLDMFQGTDQVTGTVSDGTWVAELAGDRAVFDGRTSISPQAGKYTLVIAGKPDSLSEPGGDGVGTVSIDKAGKVRLTALLADGTKLSQSASLSKNGLWPLFAKLYGGGGLVIGWISFAEPADEDVSGQVWWIKPSRAGDKYYPNGFTNDTIASGSHYSSPAGGTRVLNLTNGQVEFSGGNLAHGFTNEVTLDGQNALKNLSPNHLSISFSLSTGLFSGSVEDPATSRSFSFKGVVLQSQKRGAGFFLGGSQSGEVKIEAQD